MDFKLSFMDLRCSKNWGLKTIDSMGVSLLISSVDEKCISFLENNFIVRDLGSELLTWGCGDGTQGTEKLQRT